MPFFAMPDFLADAADFIFLICDISAYMLIFSLPPFADARHDIRCFSCYHADILIRCCLRHAATLSLMPLSLFIYYFAD